MLTCAGLCGCRLHSRVSTTKDSCIPISGVSVAAAEVNFTLETWDLEPAEFRWTAPDLAGTFSMTHPGDMFEVRRSPARDTVTVSRSIGGIAASGTYTFRCGPSPAVAFCLHLEAPPTVEVAGSAIASTSSSPPVLTCRVTGHPRPNITWHLLLDPHQAPVLDPDSSSSDQLEAHTTSVNAFTFTSAVRPAVGRWPGRVAITCSATNTLGRANSTTQLTVVGGWQVEMDDVLEKG